jgi:hypothetical protein
MVTEFKVRGAIGQAGGMSGGYDRSIEAGWLCDIYARCRVAVVTGPSRIWHWPLDFIAQRGQSEW